MKKIAVIGDIHGRLDYEYARLAEKNADRIVFLGDYFDSPPSLRHKHEDVFGKDQLDIFLTILDLKRNMPERVVMLLGNHDYHYLPGISSACSGYQPQMHGVFEQALKQGLEEGLLQWIHTEDGYLFSHAGVTKTWMANCNISSVDEINGLPVSMFGFTPGPLYDGYGNEKCQTPIWVRPESLLDDKIEGYKQVVGHTVQPQGITHEEGVYFIDTLHVGDYLRIIDGVAETANIKEYA